MMRKRTHSAEKRTKGEGNTQWQTESSFLVKSLLTPNSQNC